MISILGFGQHLQSMAAATFHCFFFTYAAEVALEDTAAHQGELLAKVA